MKRITIFLMAILVALVCVGTCKAQTLVYDFEKITAADTVTHEIEFVGQNTFGNTQVVYIIVDADNTGTIQFAIAYTGLMYPIRSRFQAYAAGEKIPVTIQNGRYNIYYKASAAGNAFAITN